MAPDGLVGVIVRDSILSNADAVYIRHAGDSVTIFRSGKYRQNWVIKLLVKRAP